MILAKILHKINVPKVTARGGLSEREGWQRQRGAKRHGTGSAHGKGVRPRAPRLDLRRAGRPPGRSGESWDRPRPSADLTRVGRLRTAGCDWRRSEDATEGVAWRGGGVPGPDWRRGSGGGAGRGVHDGGRGGAGCVPDPDWRRGARGGARRARASARESCSLSALRPDVCEARCGRWSWSPGRTGEDSRAAAAAGQAPRV